MIPEVLLSCAMSLPGLFGGERGSFRNVDVQVFKMLRDQMEVVHNDRRENSFHRILVLHHRNSLVDSLLREGLQSWIFSRFPSGDSMAIQGDLKRSPIRRRSIEIVVVIQALSDISERCATLAMIAPGGFLVVDLAVNANILNTMHEREWEYLPFKWHYHSIFRRAG